ncbi:signal recognition particle 54 kDa protein 2 [Histomonas meleagridis]|nr:signal recognition particle 54 kDa protein 2 [Histomonas meleagridis]
MQVPTFCREIQQLEMPSTDEVILFGWHHWLINANTARAFSKAVSVGSIIVTKLDSDAKGGGALSAVAATGSPISFYGTGEGIDSLEVFDAKSFISRMLGFGDVMAFARKMEEIDMDKQKEIAQRILVYFTFKGNVSTISNCVRNGRLIGTVDTMGI